MLGKITRKDSGILLFGITPPKKNSAPDKISEITAKTVSRISALPIDALVLYDIQDEPGRSGEIRPFPFMETLDPYVFANTNLAALEIPKIVYRATGKYTVDEFSRWIRSVDVSRYGSVFVGSPSGNTISELTLKKAYSLRNELNSNLLLGGVLIPERHAKKDEEHLRMLSKIDQGCSFFITQCVYNVEAARNLLSDYYYYECERKGVDKVPVIFTLTTCGSQQTLSFMKWLGITIPRWLENDLIHSHDILEKSVELCESIATELADFCAEKKIPFGINVESVSIRKAEIDASVELVHRMAGLLRE